MAEPMQQFTKSDYELTAKKSLFKGFFKIDLYQFRHKLFAGGWSGEISREILERGHAVAVLPYDPVLDRFVFIEQFRAGAIATSDNPWLMEIVAGVIDAGETTEAVAIREAEEEAGLQITQLIPLLNYLPSPGGMSERIYLYLGAVDSSEAGGIHGLETENEDIKVHCIDVDETMELLAQGKFENSAIIIALQYFALHKETLLAQLGNE